jgi:hypothetical protein
MGEICSKCFRTKSIPPKIMKTNSNKQVYEIDMPIVGNTAEANIPYQEFYNENV